MGTRARVGYAAVLLAACSWGLWPLILRRAEAIATMPAALESAIVMSVVVLASAPFAVRDQVRRSGAPRRLGDWGFMAWLGVGDALNMLLFFAAYQRTSVAVAVLTHYLTPLFVAVTAPLILREKARPRTGVAVVIAFAGLALLLQPWAAERRATDAVGALLGAGSAVFYASNVLTMKRIAGVFTNAELLFFHTLVSLPILFFAIPSGAVASAHPAAVGLVALGGLGPGALGAFLFVFGLKRIPASHASTLTLLEPLVAILLGALVFGESLGFWAIVGAGAILTGARLVVSGGDGGGEGVAAETRGLSPAQPQEQGTLRDGR